MHKKTISIILFTFILINAIVYKITDVNATQRIDATLEQNFQRLTTHYKILLRVQNITALTLYDFAVHDTVVIDTLSKARYASKEQQQVLRDKLQAHLKGEYKRAKMQGVLQYQFQFPDNRTFLRMHKPSKFGDDLTNIREDYKVVNKTKKPMRVFTQGRTTHGFRNTFPLFDFNGKHIGAMEVSFSSEYFQRHLIDISRIHTHFLVDKKIFDAKSWARDDLIYKYQKSAEHPNYVITMTDQLSPEKDIVETSKILQPIRKDIDAGIKREKEFSTFVKYNKDIEVISFLPIKNIKNKTAAWLVSYEKSDFINYTINEMLLVRGITLLFSLIIVYFVLKQQQLLDKEKDLSDKLQKSNDELEKLNESLAQKIEKALKENTKQLEILQQQSKLAGMGEMIGAIAHQWRQPLNEVSISIQNTKYDFKNGEIDEAYIRNFIDENKKVINFMSKTIDDFRNFFRVDKEKCNFKVLETIKSVISMQSAQLKNHHISLNINGDEFVFNGLQSEFQQVILNLINNAKDVLIEKDIENPTIDITLKDNVVYVEDNGGGIPKDIIDRIFEPYFTTKVQGKGTGMGLYMSKMIIEDNMGGSLSVQNRDVGTRFMIDLSSRI